MPGTVYLLDPATPVLSRPDGTVQVGWDPRRAVQVRPPDGMSATALAAALRLLQSGATVADLRRVAGPGLTDDKALEELLNALIDTAVVAPAPVAPARPAAVRIHGRGPLSDLLADALRCSSARIQRSTHGHGALSTRTPRLVVLTDVLVADPRLIRALHTANVAHLAVRVRDGTGLVGPLVLPGVTSCLGCADLHRCDRDDAWPALAAQLRDTVGYADRATVLATAALALTQIDQVLRRPARAVHDAAPATLDTTLEVRAGTGTVLARRWSRHPRCDC